MPEVSPPETVISPNIPKPLETTVRIGNEFAHVRVTPGALRNNLIVEAIQQGIPEDVARSHAEKTTFMFGRSEDFYAQLATEQKSFIKSLPDRIVSFFRRDSFFGVVGTEKKDGSKTCALSPKSVAQDVNIKYGQSPVEVQEAATLQLLDAIWRHERQHLIQSMSPEKKAILDRERAATEIIGGTLLGVQTAAFACLFLPEVPTSTKKDMFLVMAATQVAIGVGSYIKAHHVPSEREAYKMGEPEHYKHNSPFQITFEK